MSTFNALYIKFILAAGFNKAANWRIKSVKRIFITQRMNERVIVMSV